MASTSKLKRNQREKSMCYQYFNSCEQITAIIGELSSFMMLHFSLTKRVKVTEFKDLKEAVGWQGVVPHHKNTYNAKHLTCVSLDFFLKTIINVKQFQTKK